LQNAYNLFDLLTVVNMSWCAVSMGHDGLHPLRSLVTLILGPNWPRTKVDVHFGPRTEVHIHFGPWSVRSLVSLVLSYFGPRTEVHIHFGPWSVRSSQPLRAFAQWLRSWSVMLSPPSSASKRSSPIRYTEQCWMDFWTILGKLLLLG